MSLIDRLKQEEGFRGYAYKDSLGNYTIGYGTKLPLSKFEAQMLLQYRLDLAKNDVVFNFPWILEKPQEAREIIYEMAYQMGITRLKRFTNTLQALKEDDYQKASEEIINSLWYQQTPNRAKRLSERMGNIKQL